MSARQLARGQWLAQENRVTRVFIRRGRWVMRDSTGEEYAERDFPDGFVTWDVAPWPYNNAGRRRTSVLARTRRRDMSVEPTPIDLDPEAICRTAVAMDVVGAPIRESVVRSALIESGYPQEVRRLTDELQASLAAEYEARERVAELEAEVARLRAAIEGES